MKYFITPLIILTILGSILRVDASEDSTGSSAPWQPALPGYDYTFPKDHGEHRDYKTEWWYFTGNLRGADGTEYGYELTFFRQGMVRPSRLDAMKVSAPLGRFAQQDFKFAHFAISDITRRKFYYVEKINRGAFGEAGFSGEQVAGNAALAWIEDWSLTPQPDGSWSIAAKVTGADAMSINLNVKNAKSPVVHGEDGASQKSAGLGNASHYYSFTRLATTGTLTVGPADTPRPVKGESWFDHEWASNQLGSDQVGWDWFCCQFNDGTELMLYAMRRPDGGIDPVSSGTWVLPDGTTKHLAKTDFELRPLRTWKSERTGGVYPLAWQVSIPSLQLAFNLRARFDGQELALHLINYWEGAVGLDGTRAGKPVRGVGYMELTGYAGALTGLQKTGEAGGGKLSGVAR